MFLYVLKSKSIRAIDSKIVHKFQTEQFSVKYDFQVELYTSELNASFKQHASIL